MVQSNYQKADKNLFNDSEKQVIDQVCQEMSEFFELTFEDVATRENG